MSEKNRPLRCMGTGNPCGTDTWPDMGCKCANCRAWIVERDKLAQLGEKVVEYLQTPRERRYHATVARYALDLGLLS